MVAGSSSRRHVRESYGGNRQRARNAKAFPLVVTLLPSLLPFSAFLPSFRLLRVRNRDFYSCFGC